MLKRTQKWDRGPSDAVSYKEADKVTKTAISDISFTQDWFPVPPPLRNLYAPSFRAILPCSLAAGTDSYIKQKLLFNALFRRKNSGWLA